MVIAAASGTGKSSLARALIAGCDGVELSVSHTSRDLRVGEVDGQDYHFIAKADFENMIAAGEFIEYAMVFGHYYGTSHRAISSRLAQGVNVVLDIDWQGARQLRAAVESVVSIFLLPPSLKSLHQRLLVRGRDSQAAIDKRMSDAVSEMKHCFEFDHIVVNDVFEDALQDLKYLIGGDIEQVRPVPEDLLARLHLE